MTKCSRPVLEEDSIKGRQEYYERLWHFFRDSSSAPDKDWALTEMNKLCEQYYKDPNSQCNQAAGSPG